MAFPVYICYILVLYVHNIVLGLDFYIVVVKSGPSF